MRIAVAFEQPTPPLPKPSERPALADALRALPGRWSLIGQHHNNGSLRQAAYEVRRGDGGWSAFGPGFEAQTVTLCGEHRMYARYAGPQQ